MVSNVANLQSDSTSAAKISVACSTRPVGRQRCDDTQNAKRREEKRGKKKVNLGERKGIKGVGSPFRFPQSSLFSRSFYLCRCLLESF